MWSQFLSFLALTAILSQVVAEQLCLEIRRDERKNSLSEKFKSELESYSTIITLKASGSTRVTDQNLIWLAEKGYAEMYDILLVNKGYKGMTDKNEFRGSMTVLAPQGRNEIFLASSVKGGDIEELISESGVGDHLSECGHRTNGRCGELNVLQLYHDHSKGCDPKGSRIAVWGTGGHGPPKLLPPCSEGGNGCKKLVGKFDLKAITRIETHEPAGWKMTAENLRNKPS